MNSNSTEQPHTPLAISDQPANPAPLTSTASLNVDSGEPIKLDQLGPMIINSDGTISRITNWHELTPAEQERTVRVLVKKRNVMRLKKMEELEADKAA